VTTSLALPRLALVGVGTVLLLHGLRTTGGASTRTHPGRNLVGRWLGFCAGLAAWFGWRPGEGREDQVAQRLAMAPTCWPARLVARGLARAHGLAGSRESDAPSGSLAALVHALQLNVCLGLASAGLVPLAVATSLPLAALVGMASGAIGWVLPDLALRFAASRAGRDLPRRVAGVVDVLAAGVAVGLPLPSALEFSVHHAPAPAAAALRGAAARCATGASPADSLALEGSRFGFPVLRDVGEAVDRHTRRGTALAPQLRRIAARTRRETRSHLLEKAARRGPLATLVVALVIAPICLTALTACLVGGLVQGGTLGL
jgi:Flp pilus assembly protein TadB